MSEVERCLVTDLATVLRGDLLAELSGFGQHLGYDGKDLLAHAAGRTCPTSGQPADPDADWGCHQSEGKPDKVWFGYGLYAIADTVDEIPVAWRLTRVSASAVKTIEGMLPARFRAEPELAARCRDLSADRGLDSGLLKKDLWGRRRIRP